MDVFCCIYYLKYTLLKLEYNIQKYEHFVIVDVDSSVFTANITSTKELGA